MFIRGKHVRRSGQQQNVQMAIYRSGAPAANSLNVDTQSPVYRRRLGSAVGKSTRDTTNRTDSRGPSWQFGNPEPLLIPQRDHRIDLRGSPRRHVTGSQSNSCQYDGNCNERERIGGAYAKQQTRK